MKSDEHAGFTLIELLVVIAIVALLTATLIPSLLGTRARAFDAVAISCARSIALAQESFLTQAPAYSGALADLDVGIVRECGDGSSPISVDDSDPFATDGWQVTHESGSGRVFLVLPGGVR